MSRIIQIIRMLALRISKYIKQAVIYNGNPGSYENPNKKADIVKLKKELKKARRQSDLLFCLLVGLLIAVGVHKSPEAPGEENKGKIILCNINNRGELNCPVPIEKVEGAHIELTYPACLESQYLCNIEDRLLLKGIKSLKKVAVRK